MLHCHINTNITINFIFLIKFLLDLNNTKVWYVLISLFMKKLLHSQKTVVYTNYNSYKFLNISEQCIAVQYIAVHCKSTICYTVKFNESRDLNCCALQLNIILKLFSEVHYRGKKCSVKFRPGLCQRVHSS